MSYEVLEGLSFEQCDVDKLWINNKLENDKYFIVGNVYVHLSYAWDKISFMFKACRYKQGCHFTCTRRKT